MCVITDEEIHDGTALFSDDETLAFIKEFGVSEKDSKKHQKMLEKAGKSSKGNDDGGDEGEMGVVVESGDAVESGEIELHENKSSI